MFLSTEMEYVYTKITTVNPYYVFVNQSNYTILVEQAEMKQSDDLDYQLPIILEPNQRKAFFFNRLDQNMPGIDEFLHIKLLDEEISGKDLEEIIKDQETLRDESDRSIRSSLLSSPSKAFGVYGNSQQKKDMIFVKHYRWSSPFMISEVDSFTLKIRPHVRKLRLKEQMYGLNSAEKQLLTKIMGEP
jgi:hypothetical protein